MTDRVTHMLYSKIEKLETLLKVAHNNLRPCEQRGRTAYSLCHCKPCEINREIEKYLMGEKS